MTLYDVVSWSCHVISCQFHVTHVMSCHSYWSVLLCNNIMPLLLRPDRTYEVDETLKANYLLATLTMRFRSVLQFHDSLTFIRRPLVLCWHLCCTCGHQKRAHLAFFILFSSRHSFSVFCHLRMRDLHTHTHTHTHHKYHTHTRKHTHARTHHTYARTHTHIHARSHSLI